MSRWKRLRGKRKQSERDESRGGGGERTREGRRSEGKGGEESGGGGAHRETKCRQWLQVDGGKAVGEEDERTVAED